MVGVEERGQRSCVVGGGGRRRADRVTERYRVARHTHVAVAQDLLAIEPLLADVGEDLLVLLRRAIAQPATRLIGVVDAERRLVGVLPILRLIESVVARVSPESLLADIADIADVARFGHAVEARTAGDAMLPPAAIAPEATIGEAFRVMHQRHLSALYVVGPDQRPTGYLDLLELAVLYVDALEQQAASGSDAARSRLDPTTGGNPSGSPDA
jgi:CBS domain-containing protein